MDGSLNNQPHIHPIYTGYLYVLIGYIDIFPFKGLLGRR